MDAQASNEALGPHGSGKQAATLPAELANHPDYEIVRGWVPAAWAWSSSPATASWAGTRSSRSSART